MNKILQIGNLMPDTKNFSNHQPGRVYSVYGISPTLNTCGGGNLEPKIMVDDVHMEVDNVLKNESEYRIRKLTPRECFRLMGFDDVDFLAAKTGSREMAEKLMNDYPEHGIEMMEDAESISEMSNTQLYKQAGNSIVVDVLYYIYKELYKAMPYLFEDLKVCSCFSGIGAFERGLDRLYSDIR